MKQLHTFNEEDTIFGPQEVAHIIYNFIRGELNKLEFT